jgi:radical SAM superfamily enzyme YgiQ (UPF0313 family)
MRESGDILLVACYELGHQPLALAWPQAFLERAGYRPSVLDLSVEPFDEAKVARARLVAIAVPMHTALRLGVVAGRRVREANPGARLVYFGLYASLNASYLETVGADAVIGGETEGALVELVRALEHGRAPAVDPRPRLERLDFPVPSRAALPPLHRYAHVDRGTGPPQPAGHVEATRGCLSLCRHCPIPPVYGGRFFAVPAEAVIADIRQQVRAGATHISFGDPDFLNGPTHALRVARRLHAEFPAVTFDFTAKIEHLLRHRRHLAEFARLGCLYVVSAAESLSDLVLGHLDKGHTRRDIETVLRVTREAGIHLRPTWVAFTPWTTLDDYRELLDFVDAETLVDHVDPVQYSLRLLLPPGSLLLDHEAMRPHLGSLQRETLTYQWTHPDPRMDRLQADVADAVARAAEAQEDAARTFDRVSALAAAAGGHPGRLPLAGRLPAERPRPPRLTEAWFC